MPPHVATYIKAAEIVGVRMDEVLFIANHALLHRRQICGNPNSLYRPPPTSLWHTPHQPDLIVPTMQHLADALV
jgi:2-haloacid dehalogenase